MLRGTLLSSLLASDVRLSSQAWMWTVQKQSVYEGPWVQLSWCTVSLLYLQNSWVHFTLTSYRVKYENTSHLSVGLLKTAGHTFTVPCPLPTRMYPSFRVKPFYLELCPGSPWPALQSSLMSVNVHKEGTQDPILSTPFPCSSVWVKFPCLSSCHCMAGICWFHMFFPYGMGGTDPAGNPGPFCVPNMSFDQGING